MRFASMAASTAISLALLGCPSTPAYDCPGEGAYVTDGVGRYCAYGVVIGGFDCPPELPNRHDFEGRPPDVEPGFVCSDRPIGSDMDVPREVCRMIPACDDPGVPVDGGPRDAGPLTPLPRAMCEPECMDGPPPPPPYDPATTCYDGCNWCTCFATGLGSCTARACTDGGMIDAGAPPASQCEMLGGVCALPMSPTFTVSCPPGTEAVPGSETGLGGYRQLGCGTSEAGPFACCVPTFDCGGTECPVTHLCVGRFDRSVDAGPPVHTAECIERPASCASLADCAPGACGAHAACIAEVCMTPATLASISGSTLECGT